MKGPLITVAAAGLVAIGILAGAMIWRTPAMPAPAVVAPPASAATMPTAGHDMATMGSTNPGSHVASPSQTRS